MIQVLHEPTCSYTTYRLLCSGELIPYWPMYEPTGQYYIRNLEPLAHWNRTVVGQCMGQ